MPIGVVAVALAAAMSGLFVTSAHAQQGDPARGEQRFKECAACHSVQPGVNNVGPSLAGVFGRAAGSLPEFRYYAAMRRSGIIWTPQALDEQLKGAFGASLTPLERSGDVFSWDPV